jgi:putative tryptophan/tyrosine transport system substrate-binding protein
MLALSLTGATIALTILVALLAAEAQQLERPPRIGMLFLGSPSTQGVRAEIAREELRKLGYVEGQTITFEIRFANGRLDRVRGLTTELVRARVDVILTAGTSVVQEIRPVAGSIPIVANMIDPISAGFAESFARPGRNITGVAFEMADLTAKRLQLLKEVIPGVSRVAFLYYAGKIPEALRKVAVDQMQAAEAAARTMGLSVSMSGVEREGDFESAFMSAKRARAQAMLQLGSTSFIVHRHSLVDRATKARLPVACEEREFVVIGCLLAYGPSYQDNTRRSVTYVDRILKGAKAGELPIEQPTKFDLAINLRTARALGLTIPPSILLRVIAAFIGRYNHEWLIERLDYRTPAQARAQGWRAPA